MVIFKSSYAQQTITRIQFGLYTDSLKKGVHNYINVDAQYSNGRWLPLNAKDLIFKVSDGRLEGCNLILDQAIKIDSVKITVSLKTDSSKNCSTVIYVKKAADNERLPTAEEVINRPRATKKSTKKKG
jgi:hypothetical protein